MTTIDSAPPRTGRSLRWRVVDIVVASVLAVAGGLLFTVWIGLSAVPSTVLQGVVPGLQGLLNGPWLIAGPLAAVVVRKPGAALYAEFVGAALELLLFPSYGASVLLSGLVQGLGAEAVFLLLAYRRFGVVAAALSGAVSGLAGSALLDIWTWYATYLPGQKLIYVATTVVSGAVFGAVCVPLVRAIAATGVLDRFASGRGSRRAV